MENEEYILDVPFTVEEVEKAHQMIEEKKSPRAGQSAGWASNWKLLKCCYLPDQHSKCYYWSGNYTWLRLNLVWLSVFTRAQEKTHLKQIIREVSQEQWEGYFFFSLWKYRNLPRWPKPTLYKIYIRNMHSPCAAVWVWELDSFKQVPWRSLLIGELGKRTKHFNTAALVTLDLP